MSSGHHPLTHPFDIEDGREAARAASALQLGAEEALRDTSRALAQDEQSYRVELAKEIARQHAAGVAWTVCADMARGEQRVAQLRYERDVARGVKEAAEQSAWRHAANRKDLGRLLDWSRGIDLRSGGQPEQPVDAPSPIIGGRRAA